MKISITFNNEEKETMVETVKEFTNIADSDIEIEFPEHHYAGKFGEYKFSNETNEFVLDLNTGFFNCFCNIIKSSAGMIKSIVHMMENLSISWLSDIKNLLVKEDEVSE